ncbi:MAG TPA: 4-hydroxy-3-methylbut-2-enyl diphosphate reductase [Frankiaceae bacterium]|jgi:4-hydroxy-3-methylbut-2-enyl diphosphate reductase|nr:4-hydroxy-3-methylbut-2-enyl diphosphate reductase [Frankiaceae bacterium]
MGDQPGDTPGDPRKRFTVFTPMLAERAAVRGRLAEAVVVRSGMGVTRAERTVARHGAGEGPVAVLGVAGAIAPHVLAGDVVVASEVLSESGTFPCPSAPLLAALLRRAGARVHVGPLATISGSKPTTTPAQRQELEDAGAIAVDMETAPIAAAAAAAGVPFAAVRVVTDTAAAPLWHPGIIKRGLVALRTVRRIAPLLEQWAAATDEREILLASPRSFCAGVERAIDTVAAALERFGAPIYVRRQIVHNAHVVHDLEERGAVFVQELDEVPDGSRVIFAAHGVAPQVRSEAVNRGLRFIDATCPLVAKVHHEVRRHAELGRTVFLLGHNDHEEVVGTVGEAADRVVVINGLDEARSVTVEDESRVAYAVQTTLAVDEAEQVALALRERFPAIVAPPSDDICYATTNRQKAVREVAVDADLVIVVGSQNSSNSARLVEVAERAGAPALLVDDASELDLDRLRGVRRIGLTAGASAPPGLVDELVHCLSGLGPIRVHERSTVTEDIRFALPKEVT